MKQKKTKALIKAPVRMVGFYESRRISPALLRPGIPKLEQNREAIVNRIRRVIKEDRWENNIEYLERRKLPTDAPYSAYINAAAKDVIRSGTELATLLKNLMVIGVSERNLLKILGFTQEYLDEKREEATKVEKEKEELDKRWDAKNVSLSEQSSILDDYDSLGRSLSEKVEDLDFDIRLFEHVKLFFIEKTYEKWHKEIYDIRKRIDDVGSDIDDQLFERINEWSWETAMVEDFGEMKEWDKHSQETEVGHAYKFKDTKYGPTYWGESSSEDTPTHCIILWNTSGDLDKNQEEQRKIISKIQKHFPSAKSFKFFIEYEMYVHDFYPLMETFVTFHVPGKGLSREQEIKMLKKQHVSLKKYLK